MIFPGFVTDIGRWYVLADAAVSSSRKEGLPFNIMEAMYCGLPVVASVAKGHLDLIRDGENGLLYPYGDADTCARCILRLLTEPEFAQNIGRQAAEDALRYSLEQVFPQVMNLYYSVLPVPAIK